MLSKFAAYDHDHDIKDRVIIIIVIKIIFMIVIMIIIIIIKKKEITASFRETTRGVGNNGFRLSRTFSIIFVVCLCFLNYICVWHSVLFLCYK